MGYQLETPRMYLQYRMWRRVRIYLLCVSQETNREPGSWEGGGGKLGHHVTWRNKKQRPDSAGLGLDSRLKTLICKEIIVTKSKEVKTDRNPAKSSNEAVPQNGLLPVVTMMMMIMIMMISHSEE
jgi:hypothetical protein